MFLRLLAFFLALVCSLTMPAPGRAMAAIADQGEASAGETITLVFSAPQRDIQNPQQASALARLGTLLHELRESREHVFFFHGGNALGPSTFSYFDAGGHMVGLLNLLEPQALLVGKGEFAFKEDSFLIRASEAIFPFVSTNLFDPISNSPPEGILQYDTYQVGQTLLGITAATTQETSIAYRPKRVVISDVLHSLKDRVQALRSQGVNCVIAVTDDKSLNPEQALAVAGADILVLSDMKEAFIRETGGKLLIGLDTVINTATVVLRPATGEQGFGVESASLVDLALFAEDQAFRAEMDLHLKSLNVLLNTPLATVGADFNTFRTSLRSGENAFGNFVADALREYYRSDIGVINGGGIRGDRQYQRGEEFTRMDLQREVPHHDPAVLLSIDGSTFLQVLEHSVSMVETLRGRFLQVSGITLQFDPNAPVGQRISEVFVKGQPLDKAKIYTLATIAYLAEGGDGFDMLKACQMVESDAPAQNLMEAVRQRIVMLPALAPTLDGRIGSK